MVTHMIGTVSHIVCSTILCTDQTTRNPTHDYCVFICNFNGILDQGCNVEQYLRHQAVDSPKNSLLLGDNHQMSGFTHHH